MTPDRTPDTVRTAPMADEIPDANVIRLERHGRDWRASIGPPGFGLVVWADTPRRAGLRLLTLCESMGWAWDDTWRGKDGTAKTGMEPPRRG